MKYSNCYFLGIEPKNQLDISSCLHFSRVVLKVLSESVLEDYPD